jgi:hypothetical protein
MLGLTAPPKESAPPDAIAAFGETAAAADQLAPLDEFLNPPPDADPPATVTDFVFDMNKDGIDTGPGASDLPDDLGLILPGYDASAPSSLDDPTEAGLPLGERELSSQEPVPSPPAMSFDDMAVSTGVFNSVAMPPPSMTGDALPSYGGPSTPPTRRAPTPRELAADVSRLAATLASEGRLEEAGMLADVEALLLSMA